MTVEIFTHNQPLGGSDDAETAIGASGIKSATPALTPVMLEEGGATLVAWDGKAAGTAVGVLALPLVGTEVRLTYYKSGTLRAEDIAWPEGVADDIKSNAFAGTAVSIVF